MGAQGALSVAQLEMSLFPLMGPGPLYGPMGPLWAQNPENVFPEGDPLSGAPIPENVFPKGDQLSDNQGLANNRG